MNTKQKGNNFERDCSRMLSLWWTNGKRDDAIWRSASSGALTTVGKGRYLAHTGDFAATDEEAAWLFEHVIIEAKRGYNRYSMQDLLDVPVKSLRKNPVWELYDKLATACYQQGKFGMLLWKRDRRDLLVFVRNQVFFKEGQCLWSLPENCDRFRLLGPDAVYLHGMPWEQFESSVSADRLKSLLNPPAVSSSLTHLTLGQ